MTVAASAQLVYVDPTTTAANAYESPLLEIPLLSRNCA